MKPISSLKLFRSQTTAAGIIAATIKLFNNPKRHLRGPALSNEPGNGRADQRESKFDFSLKTARSACAMGALNLVMTEGAREARADAIIALRNAAYKLHGTFGFIDISDLDGRRAFLKVARRALADLRAGI